MIKNNPKRITRISRQRLPQIAIPQEGLPFVEKRYSSKNVPRHLTGRYPLFLRLVWRKGRITLINQRLPQYPKPVPQQATAKGYAYWQQNNTSLSDTITEQIEGFIGAPPRGIYA
jgi:hypothetical protein